MSTRATEAMPETTAATRTRPPWWIIAVGVGLRVFVALGSIGSNDAIIWQGFGRDAWNVGFHSLWTRLPTMNHPPLTVVWAMLSYAAAGDSSYHFSLLMKLPALGGDVVSLLLIDRIVRERAGGNARSGRAAAWLFAFSPASILVTGYHCNVDSLMAMFLLLSAWLATRDRFGRAGAVLGAAINVKIVPALTIVPLLSYATSRRNARRAAIALTIAAIPFAYMLLAVGSPFAIRVFGYRPDVRPWLFNPIFAVNALRSVQPIASRALVLHHLTAVPLAIALSLCLAALRFRRVRPDFLLVSALYWCCFVLWNGGALQYVVWPIPLLAAVMPREAAAYGVAAGAWLAVAYYDALDPLLAPLASTFTSDYVLEVRLTNLLPIVALIAIICSLVRELPTRPRRAV